MIYWINPFNGNTLEYQTNMALLKGNPCGNKLCVLFRLMTGKMSVSLVYGLIIMTFAACTV